MTAPESTPPRRVHLRAVLALMAAGPVVLAVTLTGWLSLRNGERMVRALVADLQEEVAAAVAGTLRNTLDPPHLVNDLNRDLLDRGLLDPHDADQLQRHFFDQLRRIEGVGYIQLGLAEGAFVGVERTEDGFRVERTDPALQGKDVWRLGPDGARIGPPIEHVPGYRTTARTWYRAAVDAGGPAWSPIYQFSSRDRVRLGVTAVQPWRGPDGRIRGVLGTDIVLAQLGEQLRNRRLRQGGRVAVVERDGSLVAHSELDPPFTVDADHQAHRIAMDAAADPLTRAACRALQARQGGLSAVDARLDLAIPFEGDLAFVHARPFRDGRGIDWLLIVAQPRVDYTPEIRANTRMTALLCALAALLSIALAVAVSQWVVAPILALARAAQGLAAGRWEVPIPSAPTVEIATLADAFATMRADLQEQEAALAHTAERALQAQREAEAASEAKSRFLANMSHELRTPLNAILGYAELIAESGEVGPAGREDLDRIRRAGKHLLALISDVLDLSRIEAGHLPLDLSEVDAVALARDAAEDARATVEAHGNTLECALPRFPVPIRTDAHKLRQCLDNLIDNAGRFTAEGTVRVELKVQPDRVFFSVADTGVGIAPDRLESVFAPFAQGDETHTRERDGAGLGLAITREYARALGGALTVVSVLDQGSRFTLELPREPAERPAQGAP